MARRVWCSGRRQASRSRSSSCAGGAVTSVLDGASGWSSLGSGVANAAEATLSATLVGRWLGRIPDLSRRRDLRVFIVAAAGIGPALGALIGAGVPWLIGETPLG